MNDGKTGLLRHTLATLAYRGGKALRGAPAEFAEFRTGETTRTPAQILAHLGDLLDWGSPLPEAKRLGTIPRRSPGNRERLASLPRWKLLTSVLLPKRHSLVPWKGCFRARSLIPSLTLARLPCCAAWPAARCGAKTTSGRKSP